MNILIAGGTGFIGQALINALSKQHNVTVLSRSKKSISQLYGNQIAACTWDTLLGLNASLFDIVINLAGHNISASRWTDKTKQLIIDSRVNTNAVLTNWIIHHQARPHIYCASAVGVYGVQDKNDSKTMDEDTPIDFDHPKDFLSVVGTQWEKSLQPLIDYGAAVTITRFGVVLKRNEGMLKKLLPSFKLGMGSVIGDGKQAISWIHIDDVVRGYQFLLNHPELLGPFNLTAPNPVSQAEFARILAKTLKRPLFLKLPAFVVRLLFGEMGEYLLNQGQCVKPKRLPDAGFEFSYPDLKSALEHTL